MKQRPFILITNDDGISAAGLHYLWQSLKNSVELAIIAPQHEQSSVGLSTTIRHPLLVHEVTTFDTTPAWCINGTPADCVKLALNTVLKRRPDLVVSGINRGHNAGRNVLYSGTVGAIIEGIMQEIPGIAFSCYDYHLPDFQSAASHVAKIVDYVLHYPMPPGTLLNVNFPSRERHFKGFKMTRQGKGYWGENPEQRPHPSEGHNYFWLGAKYRAYEEHEDSDIYWLEQGYMTATPVHVAELTDLAHYESHKGHFEAFFS